MSNAEQDFNQADFDRFRADPKRQALVKRILADNTGTVCVECGQRFVRADDDGSAIACERCDPPKLTVTGHVIGATYRSRYWGGEYKVIGPADTRFGEGVEVECVVPGAGAHQTVGERWTHCTQLDPKDRRMA